VASESDEARGNLDVNQGNANSSGEETIESVSLVAEVLGSWLISTLVQGWIDGRKEDHLLRAHFLLCDR